MSYITIGLVIIALILVYLLYVFFVKKSSTLMSTASLKDGSNQPITVINSGQSTRYAYGIWIYVNTWDKTSEKTIFQRDGNIRLYLDTTKPSLFCEIIQDPPATLQKSLLITDNFPVQKWVYVIISSDDRIVDCYIDGKMVNSTKLENPPKAPAAPAIAPVKLGNGFDAYIAGLTNWSGPLGPQEAWDNYMKGNGSPLSKYLNAYSVNLSITKDNVEQSKYTLF
jgi:hypothetical protein